MNVGLTKKNRPKIAEILDIPFEAVDEEERKIRVNKLMQRIEKEGN